MEKREPPGEARQDSSHGHNEVALEGVTLRNGQGSQGSWGASRGEAKSSMSKLDEEAR